MKKRNVFLMLVVFVLGMFAVCFSAKNVKPYIEEVKN